MAKKIYFSIIDDTESLYNPTPASKVIPEWYKNAKSYLNNEKKPSIDQSFITIKKCVPVFDSITAGYLILLGRDIYCEQTETGPFFHWRTEGDEENGKVLTQHQEFQVQGHPLFGFIISISLEIKLVSTAFRFLKILYLKGLFRSGMAATAFRGMNLCLIKVQR